MKKYRIKFKEDYYPPFKKTYWIEKRYKFIFITVWLTVCVPNLLNGVVITFNNLQEAENYIHKLSKKT